MRQQIFFFALATLVQVSCSVMPSARVQEADQTTGHSTWHEHTLEGPSKTVNYRFVSLFENREDKQACVALEVGANSGLKSKYDALVTAYDALQRDRHNQAKRQARSTAHDEFLAQLVQAKVLCISRYHDNRHQKWRRPNYRRIDRHLFSYFDGARSHRVFCREDKSENRFTCRGSAGGILYKIDDASSFRAGKKSVVEKLVSIAASPFGAGRYRAGKKMLGIRSILLTRDQLAFLPSEERGEYEYVNVKKDDGSQQKAFAKVIENANLVSEKTGMSILPECVVREGAVSGFEEVNECHDELSPYGGFCKFQQGGSNVRNERKIKACKLKGRGILSEQAKNKLLRVSTCEYQAGAKHFYCSGKLTHADSTMKVYFERYGVNIPRRKDSTCPDEQKLVSGQVGSNFTWGESTTDAPSDTVNTRFVELREDGSINHCVAFDAESVEQARQHHLHHKNPQSHTKYLNAISEAKVLCISKYDDGRVSDNWMFSYYTGGKDGTSHRVKCPADAGQGLVCEDASGHRHTVTDSGPTIAALSGPTMIAALVSFLSTGVNAENPYDASKKMLYLQGHHMARKQKAFFPYYSREMPEFDHRDVLVENRVQRRFVRVIDKIKSKKTNDNILPFCEKSDNAITGFAAKPVCKAEFDVFNHYCRGGAGTVNICKLPKGRGVLIKRDDGSVLRVTSCGYQPAAGHFYCSGKVNAEKQPKVHFERYGVYTEQVEIATVHRCPETRTTVVSAKGDLEPPPEVSLRPKLAEPRSEEIDLEEMIDDLYGDSSPQQD